MNPWLTATLVGSVVLVAVYAARYRSVYLSAEPLSLWGQTFPSARAVGEYVQGITGLQASFTPSHGQWLVAFLLDPILLIWGDLRSRRPERHLPAWHLEGVVPIGRSARIALGVDRADLAVACRTPFQAEPGHPFEQQEALRGLHPIGSARWREGVTALETAFARGARRLRYADGCLVAEVPLAAVDARGYPALLDSLAALATILDG